jgi:hypothetical protein
MIKYLELTLSQEVYEYLEELDEMNWSTWGNVLNQYLRNTSIGTTVMSFINVIRTSNYVSFPICLLWKIEILTLPVKAIILELFPRLCFVKVSFKAVFHCAEFSARSGISLCLVISRVELFRKDKEKFPSARKIPHSRKRPLGPRRIQSRQ